MEINTQTQTVFVEMELEEPDKHDQSVNVKQEESTSPEPAPSKPNEGVRLKCSECSRVFFCVEKMACHLRRHRGQNPFQCAMCTYDTYNKTLFMEHVNGHLGVKPYQCGKCNYRSVSKKYIKIHEAKHATCDLCGHVARNSIKLMHHKKTGCGVSETEKPPRPSGSKKKKNHKTRTGVEQHVPESQVESPPSREGSTSPPPQVPCNKCDILPPDLLEKHIKKEHGIKKNIVEWRTFKCKVCEYKAHSLAKILLHLIHHPQEVHPSVDITPLVNCGFIASNSLKHNKISNEILSNNSDC